MSEPVPNALERRIATEVRLSPDALALALARAREGATLPGPRRIVSGHAQIPVDRVNPLAVARGIEYAWRSWLGELLREQLRPCGWPAVQRTYVASHLSVTPIEPGPAGWVEVDENDERAEYLIVSVSCEGVPAE